jgi:hypothetical protein
VTIDGSSAGARSARSTVLAAVAGFVLFAVAGALVTALRPATYRSEALVSLDQPLAVTVQPLPGPIAKLSRLRELYGPLLTTRTLTEPIAEETGLTPAQVADRLTALVPLNSLLLGVQGTGSSPGAAQRLTKAAADEIVRYAADTQRAAGVVPRDQIVLAVVAAADPGTKATGRPRTVVTVALLMGLLGGAAGVVLVSRAEQPRP